MHHLLAAPDWGTGGSTPPPPGKSQVAIGFLRNTDMDPPREAIGSLGPIASRGRFVWPSVKYADAQKMSEPTLTKLSGYAHAISISDNPL